LANCNPYALGEFRHNTLRIAHRRRHDRHLMWRINWIHPFDDGNGRTARMASYAVLCVLLGYELPGTKAIFEQIAEHKTP
jgi:fido (protein-threonine AMPylation protein)